MIDFLRRNPCILTVSGAVMTALTLVFPQVGALEWLTLIPIFLGIFLMCEDPRFSGWKAYRNGFFTVFAYYVILFHWFVYLYPLDFAGLDNASSLVVVCAAVVGIPLVQAVPGGLIFVFYRLIHKTGIMNRFPILRPFVFSALWLVFEWSTTLHWMGVPWGRLALGQAKILPMLQSASLLGSYFVSFLILAVNGLLALAILSEKKRLLPAVLAGVIVLSNLLFGAVAMALPEKEGDSFTAAVIQPNLNSHEKWSGGIEETIRIHAEMTKQAAEEGAQLVVWPESALPVVLNDYSWICTQMSGIAKENNVYLVVGAFYSDEEGREYNALYMVDPQGNISDTVYGKRNLVPFGEYVPMRDLIVALIPPLSEISMLEEDLTPGEGSALFSTTWGEVGSLICFDSIYEMHSLQSVRDGADLMVISSNDSWFMDSAAVYLPVSMARRLA